MRLLSIPLHALAIIAVLIALTSSCASPGQVARDPLSAAGPLIDGPAIIRSLAPQTLATQRLQPGDEIVSIDDTPTRSALAVFNALENGPAKTFSIRRRDGNVRQLPFDTLFDPSTQAWNASFLSANDEVMTESVTTRTALRAKAGIVSAGRLRGSVAASIWRSTPNIIEAEFVLSVPDDCTDCELQNVVVLDASRKAWLPPVDLESAAFAALPVPGVPMQPMNVPPPTVVGAFSSTMASGSLTAQTYGNRLTGQYSGTATTTTTPIYDYSAQTTALAYNLGAAIQNSRIEQSTRARQKFLVLRMGNLRQGKLNPGETVSGSVFFAAPPGFSGPYLVVVVANNDGRGVVRFDDASAH